MEPPLLIAIDDVCLSVPPVLAEAVTIFYSELLGLELLPRESSDDRIAMRGAKRTGPRLLIRLRENQDLATERRQATLQVRSVSEMADVLAEREIAFEWTRGLSHYERRLATADPAGNRVEMVTYHAF